MAEFPQAWNSIEVGEGKNAARENGRFLKG